MRFVLVTTGSLGDVQPFIALGLGLKRAGYEVRLAVPANYREIVEIRKLEFYPLPNEEQEANQAEDRTSGSEAGGRLHTGLQRVRAKQKIFRQVNREAWQACQGAEVMVYRIGGYLAVDSMAEKLSRPCFKAGLVPYTQTRELPSMYFYPKAQMGKLGNQLSHILGEQMIWQFLRAPVNSFRHEELGLGAYPVTGASKRGWTKKLPVLYAFSPVLVERPADSPAHVHITGHWSLEQDDSWQPLQALVNFIHRGAPPVYIGFGSMASGEAQATYDLARQALEMSGQRGVLAGDWDGVRRAGESEGRVYLVDYAPHDWLFPRMACAVHHGGIGTITANLKAGIPAVVVPFNYDQPFWGEAMRRLGAAPSPIPRKQLSAERLAEAIQNCLTNESMRQKAQQLGEKLRQEDGVGCAVETIQRYLQEGWFEKIKRIKN